MKRTLIQEKQKNKTKQASFMAIKSNRNRNFSHKIE